MDAVSVRGHDLEESATVEAGRSDDSVTGVRDLCRLNESSWLRPMRIVSIAGIAVFVAAILALHGLQPNLNAAEHTISEYALGSYGWLMRAAFFALSMATLATANIVRLRFKPAGWRDTGLVLLAAAAFGLILDAGYNTDRLRVPATTDGLVHAVGTWTLALALPCAAVVLGSTFERAGISTWKARGLQALGGVQLVALVVFEESPNSFRGLAERVVTVLAVAILALLQWAAAMPTAGRHSAEGASSSIKPNEEAPEARSQVPAPANDGFVRM